jgi:hypothetical protein
MSFCMMETWSVRSSTSFHLVSVCMRIVVVYLLLALTNQGLASLL